MSIYKYGTWLHIKKSEKKRKKGQTKNFLKICGRFGVSYKKKQKNVQVMSQTLAFAAMVDIKKKKKAMEVLPWFKVKWCDTGNENTDVYVFIHLLYLSIYLCIYMCMDIFVSFWRCRLTTGRDGIKAHFGIKLSGVSLLLSAFPRGTLSHREESIETIIWFAVHPHS